MKNDTNTGRTSEVVTASELAAYVFCPEQWRLQYGLGQNSENVTALEQGTLFHEKTARVEVASENLLSLGRILLLVGVLTLLAVILSFISW